MTSARCDNCPRTAVDRIARFDLNFCRPCGTQNSLVALLEAKYGQERAREMLQEQREVTTITNVPAGGAA